MAAVTNQLIRLTYIPRIVVYLGAALTLVVTRGPTDLPQYLLALLILFIPHLVQFINIRFFNHSAAARYVMVVDAAMVGTLIVAMDFNVLGSLTFAVCLIMGTLMIAPPAMLLLNLMIVLSICGLFFSPENFTLMSNVQDLFNAVLLMSFCAVVAWLCFRHTSRLVEVRHNIGEKNKNLKKQNTRLQPYISEQVFRSAADDIAINGRKRYLTVFFSDIEGFTYLMDHLNEDTITRMLNEYLDEMAQIAHRFGGTVDKFMGDGVMIFFGDQQSRGHREDALCCISMAIEMRLKLYGIAARWRDFGPELHIRIGIHSGFCTVGNFGSAQRMDYTAVGSTVNLASRLEGCASRDEILISDVTCRLIDKDVICHAKPPVLVKGISQPIHVFSIDKLIEKSIQVPINGTV